MPPKHKSGNFKQKNKPFKGGSGKSSKKKTFKIEVCHIFVRFYRKIYFFQGNNKKDKKSRKASHKTRQKKQK